MPEQTTDPPPTRGYKKKERTRRQLLAAAVDVIAERGEGFSVSDVVAEAGVANGTFYNYFTDRDQLIDAVVPEVLGAFAVEGAVTVTIEDPVARLATISALGLARAAASPDQIRVILRLDAVVQAIIDGEVVAHLRDDLAAGEASGRFTIAPGPSAIDVVIGALLLAARRIVDGAVGDGYHEHVVAQLLRSLGLADADAVAVATEAVAKANQIQAQS